MLTNKEVTEIKAKMSKEIDNWPLVFAALGDPGRLKILKLLIRQHDLCVTDIARIFDITVSAASQQLRVLERLGLVRKMRMGQMVCYEVRDDRPNIRRLIDLL